MADRLSVNIDTSEVINNLNGLSERAKIAIETVGNTVGSNMKAYAQANAPWTDRTGDARNKMDFKSGWEGTVFDISIFHVVDYGVWLEICNAEKYAILRNARDSQIETFKTMIKNLDL